jgi:uroporphyrinogen-III decarboxylase
MAMTSRERFLKIFQGELPDRVPVTLFIADQGHFISQVYPEIDPQDFISYQLKIIEIQKQLGFDVFVRLLYNLNDPISIHCGGVDVSQTTENWEPKTEVIQDGTTVIYRSTIRTPKGTLEQDFSVNQIRPGTFVYACTKKPVKNEKDLDLLIEYEPRMPAWWPARLKERIAPIRQALGNDGILGSWTPHGPFNNSSLLIDTDELYMLYRINYPFYEKLMNYAMERILDYTRAIDEAGVDVHCVGGNVPGGFLGKKNYDKYILPFEKKYIDFVQQNGTPAMYHNCGKIMALVDSYKELGARIVEPFSPPPLLGDADLKKVKEMVGDAYIILGGVDQVTYLQNSTVDEVRRVTAETMAIGKPGGRFILQSADFLEYGTPLENLEAFAQTAKECGWY